MAKKKKIVKKKAVSRKVSHELVVRVDNTLPVLPTVKVLEPMMNGKKMALASTWISEAQLIKIVQKTPKEHIYSRPGKGGGKFSYVTGNYVEKVLNFVFAWNWDFEVIAHGIEGGQVWVQGKLTVKSQKGDSIIKNQFGRADIKYLRGTKTMLDFGNDLKAATTDSLKKCASLLGIASDIYGKQEYKQEANIEIVEPSTITPAELKDGPEGDPVIVCQKCDGIVTPQEAEFSKKMFGKILCREDQVNAKKK